MLRKPITERCLFLGCQALTVEGQRASVHWEGQTPVCLSLQPHNSLSWHMLKVRFLYTIPKEQFVKTHFSWLVRGGGNKNPSLESSLWRESWAFPDDQMVLGPTGLLHRTAHVEGLAGHCIFFLLLESFFVETWWILRSMWSCHPVSILPIPVLWRCEVGPWIQHHAGGCLHISLHNYLTPVIAGADYDFSFPSLARRVVWGETLWYKA